MSQRAGSFDQPEELEPPQGDTEPLELEPAQELLEAPREGTLAWLELQPHVDFHGLQIPACNRIAAGSELAPLEGSTRCRVIKPSGERCRAVPTRAYGLCTGHLGGGTTDYAAMSQAGHARRAVLKQRRELLGIGAARIGSARQHARLRALDRASELAAALVDGPLDDAELGSMARQAAALRVLDAVEPLASISLEATLPAEAQAVAGLGWAELEQLATRLLPAAELET